MKLFKNRKTKRSVYGKIKKSDKKKTPAAADVPGRAQRPPYKGNPKTKIKPLCGFILERKNKGAECSFRPQGGNGMP